MIGTTASMRLGIVFAVMAALGAGTAATAEPNSTEAAACQILEIRASNEAGEIDPALQPLARKLKKPPFSAWKHFSLLKKHERSAARMKAIELALVPGGKLSLLFREKTAGERPRLRLTFTLDDKSGKRLFNGTVNLDVGDYSLIGGESLEGDATYIIGVSCKS